MKPFSKKQKLYQTFSVCINVSQTDISCLSRSLAGSSSAIHFMRTSCLLSLFFNVLLQIKNRLYKGLLALALPASYLSDLPPRLSLGWRILCLTTCKQSSVSLPSHTSGVLGEICMTGWLKDTLLCKTDP